MHSTPAAQQTNRPFLRRALHRIVQVIGILVAAAVTFIALILLAMWREHRTAIALPASTGHFAIGRTTFNWINDQRSDEANPARKPNDQLIVWVWYPAIHSNPGARAGYLPALWRPALARGQGFLMSSFFKRDPSAVQTHSFSDAPISNEQSTYPVIVLRAGASALTTDFTTLAEDLASHGYIVVGFDAAYRSFVVVLSNGQAVYRLPEYNVENAEGNLANPIIGKLLAMWTSDTKFIVNRLQQLNEDATSNFRGRLDLGRLGMFGHSFGGATALEFCHEDPRCKAAIDLDGIPFGSVVADGLTKPCMFVMSDHRRETADPSSRQVLAEINSIYDRLPAGRLFVVIRAANHFSFSDQILLNSQIAVKILARLAGFGRLDGRRGLAISADYVHTFFDVYLKRAPASSLRALSEKYPEAELNSPPAE